MPKILFYDDSPDFGGHEMMTLEAIKGLAVRDDVEVFVAYFKGNERLHQHLADLKVKQIPLSYASKSFQSARVWVQYHHTAKLAAVFKAVAPDLVIVCQGYISISSLGLLAARRVGCRVISYVPIVQKMSLVGASFGRIRDLFDRYLFALPDGFVTISHFMKSLLELRGIPEHVITIVRNGVEVDKRPADRRASRKELGIPDAFFVIGLIGRIKFSHKGHDFFLRTISRYRHNFADTMVCIVGDGPDREKLQKLLVKEDLAGIVKWLPWRSDLESVYGALDLVALPSRSEGVPLVMLEGMAKGLPIVASDLDEFSEFLPKEWMFERENSESLITTLQRIQKGVDLRLLERNKALIKSNFDIANFGERFYGAVRRHLENRVPT